MKIPSKKYITSIGLIGIIFLLVGVVLLTYALFQAEKRQLISTGIRTTARVVSVREDSCSRGKWSSRCYDLSILFTDQSGTSVTTVIEDQFDKPQQDQISIVYAQGKPELAMWDNEVKRPWLERGRLTATLLVVAGLLLYLGSLLATHRLSRQGPISPP